MLCLHEERTVYKILGLERKELRITSKKESRSMPNLVDWTWSYAHDDFWVAATQFRYNLIVSHAPSQIT